MQYVVDTNIWIELLRKNAQVRERLEQAREADDVIIVCPIVYYELLRGLEKREDLRSIGFIKSLWSTLSYIEMNDRVWDLGIHLWVSAVKANKRQEDADTLIAALASYAGATVVTKNVKHFEPFDVPIENWVA